MKSRILGLSALICALTVAKLGVGCAYTEKICAEGYGAAACWYPAHRTNAPAVPHQVLTNAAPSLTETNL